MLQNLLKLPFTDPVLIFALILFIILFSPILLHRIKIPDLIGLIIAGAIIGPNGLHIMERDSSIELFGRVGLLYIMFIAGLEIDMADLKKNCGKSIIFGMYTFLIPMILGCVAGVYVLGFSWPTSVLLASMFASHTLITYPIVSKYGVTKNRSVNVAIGGTVITCVLSLLVLAVVVGMSQGNIDNSFWIRLVTSSLVFIAIVIFAFPVIGRWFFKRCEDRVAQYIFVLALVFLASFLSKLAGLEDIIGAFLAGLALNRLIPNTSALMNRIGFVGNALFIPFFLIGVGMLIDFRVFTAGWESILVAIVMCVVATLAKYLAAWLGEKSFGYTKDEGRLLFGLSNAQAAATLAAVLVGYNVILGTDANGEPIRLLNEAVLNGTIIMILVTCTIASFVTQRSAQNIALNDLADTEPEGREHVEEHILIPLNNHESVEELIALGMIIKSPKCKATMTAVSIIKSDGGDASAEKRSQMLLEKAVKAASATDNVLHTLMRYDLNIVNGIRNVAKENKITDIVLGLRSEREISDTFLGKLVDGVLSKCPTTTIAYRPVQPLSTIRRYLVVIPPNAEREVGFPYWLVRVWNVCKHSGCKVKFYSTPAILSILKGVHVKYTIEADFHDFVDWEDFLIIARDIKQDDGLMIVMSRRNYVSYCKQMTIIPDYLNRYFHMNNCMLVYPVQMGVGEDESGTFKSISLFDNYDEEGLGMVISRLFNRNR